MAKTPNYGLIYNDGIRKLHTTWKAAKKRHDAVLTTNKVKFTQDLGKYIDVRTTLRANIAQVMKEKTKLQQTYQNVIDKRRGTDKEWTKEKADSKQKELNAKEAPLTLKIKTEFRKLESNAANMKRVATTYQDRIANLGGTARTELNDVLAQVIEGAADDVKMAQSVARL